MLKKLKLKFICFTMTIVTLMLVIIFGLVLHFTRMGMERESVRMMETIALNPRPLLDPLESTEEIKLPYFMLQLSPEGEPVSAGSQFYDLSDTAFLDELARTVLASGRQTGVIQEYSLRYCRITTPVMQCLVFADISSEQKTMSQLFHTCLAIGVVSFGIFLLISILLANLFVKPIEHAWIHQKQFVSDASHELKTPLTVILTNAEMLRSDGFSDHDRHLFSENILTMSHQMRDLVEHLLELARADSGTIKSSFSALEFSEFVSDALLPFEPLCFEKDLILENRIEPQIRITGSDYHLRQLIDILLDNAQKYAYPGSVITVELRKKGHSAILSVSSQGDTIPPHELKQIFKRFYRTDKARTRNHSYGLGLSIAESITAEHHGRIWCTSDDHLNTFYVKLPLLHCPR